MLMPEKYRLWVQKTGLGEVRGRHGEGGQEPGLHGRSVRGRKRENTFQLRYKLRK